MFRKWAVPESTSFWDSILLNRCDACSESDETHGDEALFPELGGFLPPAEIV